MYVTNNQRSVKMASLLILLVFGFATHNYADEEGDPQPPEPPESPQTTESDVEAFTVMDVAAMNTYRDERREELVESLAQSNLSAEHIELVANAMAKVYVGVPVSSYTHTSRTHSSREDPIESTNTYHVRAAGYIQREDLEYKNTLDSNAPFMYFPPVPFESETGRLLDETDSTSTFEFELGFSLDNEGDVDMMSDLADKMKWVFVIAVNNAEQAPEHITVKLAKPVRKRFLFKLSTFQMKFDYTFIESCGCFAVSRMNMEMKGSAIIIGRLNESVELTNTDISCEQPVLFLQPDKEEFNFISF